MCLASEYYIFLRLIDAFMHFGSVVCAGFVVVWVSRTPKVADLIDGERVSDVVTHVDVKHLHRLVFVEAVGIRKFFVDAFDFANPVDVIDQDRSNLEVADIDAIHGFGVSFAFNIAQDGVDSNC